MLIHAEYLWLDGGNPTQRLRSKNRYLTVRDDANVDVTLFPEWGYDGSSTYQADGTDSDLTLRPVTVVPDPLHDGAGYLVLCEVFDADGNPHGSNTRAMLRRIMETAGSEHEPWMGIEQEYTLFDGTRPLGWPTNGYPAPQGPYYCGVGAGDVFGRGLVRAHAAACVKAGLMIYGTNAEVMPAQWEFQIGYRGNDAESADPLTVSDHLWFARWLLLRLGEDFGVTVSFEPKPVVGDWNGAGAHTNFSTKSMRLPGFGLQQLKTAIMRLGERHRDHIAEYGDGLDKRLTGLHETCAIDQFRGGIADRGASIRIPRHVMSAGHGYLEDRRPGANCDPYRVAALLLDTICMEDERENRLPTAV